MGFDTLYGNDRLKENLISSLSRGRISHFYLICGAPGSGKRTLARLLGAAILCQGTNKPCMTCPACRKAINGTHPDFITVDDPEKKTVPVELIRWARTDMYIQPNEADRKIYLFPRGQDMGLPGQNALLKVLEEPPEYGVFLLLTDNPERLLPTVRSRCTELTLTPLPEQTLLSLLGREFPQADRDALQAAVARSGGYLGQARTLLAAGEEADPQTGAFAQAYGSRDALGLVRVLVPMEKWKRDPLIAQLQKWAELLESALATRSGAAALSPMAKALSTRRSSQELMAAIAAMEKCIEYAQGNVSPAAICGYLEWALR